MCNQTGCICNDNDNSGPGTPNVCDNLQTNESPTLNGNSTLDSPIQSQTNDNSMQFESSRADSTFINSIQTEIDSFNLHDNVNVHAIENSSMMAQPLNLNLTAKGFKIGHLNIQGIQNKFDQVQLKVEDRPSLRSFLWIFNRALISAGPSLFSKAYPTK